MEHNGVSRKLKTAGRTEPMTPITCSRMSVHCPHPNNAPHSMLDLLFTKLLSSCAQHETEMNQRTLDRDSPEYCIAAGRLGMDRLLEHPFKPFVIVFADMCADRSAPRIAYKILNPIAINLRSLGLGIKLVSLLMRKQVLKTFIYPSLWKGFYGFTK